jgi:hypothetical protein
VTLSIIVNSRIGCVVSLNLSPGLLVIIGSCLIPFLQVDYECFEHPNNKIKACLNKWGIDIVLFCPFNFCNVLRSCFEVKIQFDGNGNLYRDVILD